MEEMPTNKMKDSKLTSKEILPQSERRLIKHYQDSVAEDLSSNIINRLILASIKALESTEAAEREVEESEKQYLEIIEEKRQDIIKMGSLIVDRNREIASKNAEIEELKRETKELKKALETITGKKQV